MGRGWGGQGVGWGGGGVGRGEVGWGGGGERVERGGERVGRDRDEEGKGREGVERYHLQKLDGGNMMSFMSMSLAMKCPGTAMTADGTISRTVHVHVLYIVTVHD